MAGNKKNKDLLVALGFFLGLILVLVLVKIIFKL
jgi:uncharacterized protein involved in exopolysaccharide biosynthesis